MSHLTPQSWNAIETTYFETAPFNYAVLDDVLTNEVCDAVREELMSSWAWQLMNSDGKELFVRDFGSAPVEAVAAELIERLPKVLGGLSLEQYIAFWHHQNAGLYAHSDIGQVSLNLWLTPDEYNRNPESGGLILHDVKRRDDMEIHEFNCAPWSTDYLAANTKGNVVRVPYRFNRAVLFDSRTFHASDGPLDFVNEGPESIRLNLTFMFDERARFQARLARYYAYADGPPVET
jgi:hypothetical protein